MALALIIAGIVLLWYCVGAVAKNPRKPDWARAFVMAALWPLSLFIPKRDTK